MKWGEHVMYSSNAEPSLDEMLDDPIVQLRMQGAGLQAEDVRACMKHAQERLHDRRTEDKRGKSPDLRGSELFDRPLVDSP